MNLIRTLTTVVVFSYLNIAVICSTQAQTTAPSDVSDKAVAKNQRKADRKAHRAATNTELETLQKNGYKQNDDRTKYPQDLQNAQAKANGQKGSGSKAASAP